MTPLLSTWLWLSFAPAVTVESDMACPRAEDVAARVTALLPARETSGPPDIARVADRGDVWLVTLSRLDGTPIGERALERGVACADLAAAAAVIIATWESDVHAEFRPEAPHAVPPPAAATVVAMTRAASPREASIELGAALTGALAPSSAGAAPALGVLLVGSWRPSRRGLGLRLAVGASAERELPLGDARVAWRRIAPALGTELRLAAATRPWALDLHADALAGWVTASGQGFATDRSVNGLDVGVGAGTRLAWLRWGIAMPWLELAGAGWLRPQTAYTTGSASVALPRVELTLALGLSLRVGKL